MVLRSAPRVERSLAEHRMDTERRSSSMERPNRVTERRRDTEHREPVTEHPSKVTERREPVTEHPSKVTERRSRVTEHRAMEHLHRVATEHRAVTAQAGVAVRLILTAG